MSIRFVAVALGAVLVQAVPARAVDPSAMSCGQLWHNKNAFLKSKGFCFTDPRAVRTFGNDGCALRELDRVPMTSAERQTMARILLAEKIKLCR